MGDLGNEAIDIMKKRIKQALKTFGKKITKMLLTNPYFWLALLVILVVILVAGYYMEVEAQAAGNSVYGTDGGMSLTTTMFDKSTFKKAMEEYYNSTNNKNFYNNFLSKVDELYDTAVSNNVNPELVVVTAKCEGNFTEQGGAYNYWGIGVANGKKDGSGYNSLKDGIIGYASVIKQCCDGGKNANAILTRYEERKNAGCDSTGYGLPGTLAGMQSVYSWLGKHEQGSSSVGGYYYMDPDRAGVTKIYSTHEEFLNKCYNAGGEHSAGTICTPYETGQYTAWQVEKKLDVWNEIFGKYGSLQQTSNTNGSEAASNTPGIKGYYTSSFGKKYTLYLQNVKNTAWEWSEGCLHCCIATIVSGYNANVTPNQLSGWRNQAYSSDVEKYSGHTSKLYRTVNSADVINELKQKHELYILVEGKTIKTNNGSSKHQHHYLAVLDYKEENGESWIYIHDPWNGHNGYGWGKLSDNIKSIKEFRAVGY